MMNSDADDDITPVNDPYVRIKGRIRPGECEDFRGAYILVGPLDGEPGAVHVMVGDRFGELLDVVLDEVGARITATALMAPFGGRVSYEGEP